MPGVYENKCQESFPNIYCYVLWQSQFVLNGCWAFMKINTRILFPTSTAMSLDSRSLFSMDDWHLFSEMPGLFSQRLLLWPLTVAVCSRWMPGIYENKYQNSFPNIYCYVPDSHSLFSKDARRLWKWTPGLFSQRLLLCPLTVAVCSRWMPGFYENKCQESFPNTYCYVPWQSQFVLEGCLAFMKINARNLFPMSTAMSLDSRSLFSMDAWHLFS